MNYEGKTAVEGWSERVTSYVNLIWVYLIGSNLMQPHLTVLTQGEEVLIGKHLRPKVGLQVRFRRDLNQRKHLERWLEAEGMEKRCSCPQSDESMTSIATREE